REDPGVEVPRSLVVVASVRAIGPEPCTSVTDRSVGSEGEQRGLQTLRTDGCKDELERAAFVARDFQELSTVGREAHPRPRDPETPRVDVLAEDAARGRRRFD